MVKVDFDEYVREYDKLLNKNLSFFSKDDSYFCRYKAQLIKRYSRHKPAKILEFGAGIGRNIPFIREIFPESEIFAYDVSQKSLDYLAAKYPYVRIIREFSGFSESFDLVFCSVVYHHIPVLERQKATDDIYEALRKGGEFFVFEHNPLNPVTRKLVERCPYDEDAVLLGPKEMKAMASSSGFSSFMVRYYLYFPPALRLSMIERFFYLLPFGGQYMLRAEKL
ncbi:MAG: class I SAM-dependent methyltransferase [Elusimicrobiota bacterium]